MTRRDFLKVATGSAVAGCMGSDFRLSARPAKIQPRADAMILLWMAGGMAQTETFDPKRYTPYAPGLEAKSVLSTFPAIDTAADPIKISQGLERIAQVMDRATLIRSHRVGDLGTILHARHQYHWHTGYAPPQTVAAPHMGAVIARVLGPKHPDMPAFIDIGQDLEKGAESDGLKAFHNAGFLGSAYGPFLITDPNAAMQSMRPPGGMSLAIFQERYRQYKQLLAASPAKDLNAYQKESFLQTVENAHRLLASPVATAFDISREPKETYATYHTGRFGLGCLLARRLVESGARFIEVTTEYIPFERWDTHERGHERAVEMKREIDTPVSQLIRDLAERGLLERTIVVIASEFGRDMLVEGKPGRQVADQAINMPSVMTEPRHYGMHRHFTEASSVVIFGGGFKKGFVYGKTADERPCNIIEKPVSIEDLHATLYTALGIPPDLAHVVESRPFFVTKDGKGALVTELFA